MLFRPKGSNNQIKRLKVVMKYAFENGYTAYRSYERFKKLTEYQNEVVFLTLEELDTLVAADLSDDPRLARVRDMFRLRLCHRLAPLGL